MMTAPAKLDRGLQTLIDDRLDAIDRVLLDAGVPRGERQCIVEEVEAQVHELLGRGGGEPARADLIAVLDALDPPEAYAPEGSRPRRPAPDRPARPRVSQPSLLALGSALGGLFLLLTAALAFFLAAEGDELLLPLLLAGFLVLAGVAVSVCGVFAIRQVRAAGGWLTGMSAAVFGAIVFPLLAVNGLVLAVVFLFEEIGLIALAVMAVVAGNAYAVARAWRWAAADYRPAPPPTADGISAG